MLIATILSSLGLSVFADKQNNDQEDYYTIFEWNDGMKMQRRLSWKNKSVGVYARTDFFRCDDYLFYIHNIDTSYFIGSITKTDYGDPVVTRGRTSARYKDRTLIGQRIAWLTFMYLRCNFSASLDREELGFLKSSSLDSIFQLAEGGAPDKADPYEIAVYETGQMDKSLFILNQEDFLKTIGRS